MFHMKDGDAIMTINSKSYRDDLYNQIEEAFGKVVYTYTTHIIQAGRIQKYRSKIKWIEVVLSATSMCGYLATVITDKVALSWIGGICSVGLLILGSAEWKMSNCIARQSRQKGV